MLKRLFFDAVLPAICAIGVGYNVLVAINGDEGRRAFELVQEKRLAQEAELQHLRHQRADLERRAHLLSRAGLDHDMLDESARRVLGFAAPGEKVISLDEIDRITTHSDETE